VAPEDSDNARLARSRLGRKPQVGGCLAVFLGILLLVFLPPASPGSQLNPHQMAIVFIVIGALLIAAGTLARWLYLN
jgi:hypothetical protein